MEQPATIRGMESTHVDANQDIVEAIVRLVNDSEEYSVLCKLFYVTAYIRFLARRSNVTGFRPRTVVWTEPTEQTSNDCLLYKIVILDENGPCRSKNLHDKECLMIT